MDDFFSLKMRRARAAYSIGWLAALLCGSSSAQTIVPEQVHISLTNDANEAIISWAVRSTCSTTSCRSVVAYSTTNATPTTAWSVSSDLVSTTLLSEGQAIDLRIINVRLSGLFPNTTYFYLPGGSGSGGNVSSFVNGRRRTSLRNLPTNVPPEFVTPPIAVYSTIADLGLEDGYAIQRLMNDSLAGNFADLLLHAGDIAYDLHSSSGAVGDGYMRAMQPVVAQVPYFTTPGNHECNLYLADKPNCFVQYTKRFSNLADTVGRASGSGSALWYSFDHGPVHIVAIDTELPFYYGSWANISDQTEWLQRDLMAVNRTKTPWVVAMGHKQIWMDKEDMGFLEAIMQAGGVDLYFTGHTHNYQRLLPQSAGTVYSSCASSDRRFYRNCPAMTTFVVGSAGNREAISLGRAPSGVATQWLSYAVGYLYVVNATHLYFRAEEIADFNGTVIDKGSPLKRVDDVWIVKTTQRAMNLPMATPSSSPTMSAAPATPTPTAAGSSTAVASAPVILAQWTFENTTAPVGGMSSVSASFAFTGTAALWGSGYTSGTGASGALAVTVTSFPAQGVGNATSGVVACVSTTGYSPVQLTVDLQASNTGSKFRLAQYRPDAAGAWRDIPSGSALLTASNGGVFNSFSVDLIVLDSIMADNPSACWRIVQVFAPGNTSYAAANSGSSYASAGTLRVDNLIVYGLPLPSPTVGASTPSISATISGSSTPSRSASVSVSYSSTGEPIASSTASRTVSVSLSGTATVSGSAAATVTRSRSSSDSSSVSPASTRTASSTVSPGPSGTGTATLSASASAAATGTSSGTVSVSGSSTISVSATASLSGSGSISASSSVTGTPAVTSTATGSRTVSVSGSGTPASTSSPAATQSGTPSRSASATTTCSWSATKTLLVPSRSRTATPTLTRSRSGTASKSRTRSATAGTKSRTASATATRSRSKKGKR